jgi:hypothetical protein
MFVYVNITLSSSCHYALAKNHALCDLYVVSEIVAHIICIAVGDMWAASSAERGGSY